MTNTQTLGQQKRMEQLESLTQVEANCVRELHLDGWTVGELSMTFQCSGNVIRRVLNGDTYND